MGIKLKSVEKSAQRERDEQLTLAISSRNTQEDSDVIFFFYIFFIFKCPRNERKKNVFCKNKFLHGKSLSKVFSMECFKTKNQNFGRMVFRLQKILNH